VTREPNHCLGVYAEVLRPGVVSVGDEVHVAG
jgi:MOSC domain-containing protein YiiM